MTLDFLRPITELVIRRRRSTWAGLPVPPLREIEALRMLRDDQLRWYISQHGQAFLRRELERRKGR